MVLICGTGALRLRLSAGPGRPIGHSHELRTRRPCGRVLLQDLPYAGVALLRREVHRTPALVVLQGRGCSGGQQQADHARVALKARDVEGSGATSSGQVDEAAAPNEQI